MLIAQKHILTIGGNGRNYMQLGIAGCFPVEPRCRCCGLWTLLSARNPQLTYSFCYGRVVLFSLIFPFFFVQCRFATSVPFELSSPIYQGTKVSIWIFFSQLSISVYIFVANSVSNGENLSLPKISAGSVSNCKTLSKSENLSNPENLISSIFKRTNQLYKLHW